MCPLRLQCFVIISNSDKDHIVMKIISKPTTPTFLLVLQNG